MVCGRRGETQIHHVYGGAYRKRSEAYDFVLEVCPECHRRIHDTSLGERLKRVFQERWEATHRGGHEEWMRLMGRSWL